MLDAVATLARSAAEGVPGSIAALQAEIDRRMRRIPTRLNSYGYDR